VTFFKNKGDFCRKTRLLQPAWLWDFLQAVDADRVFIWGKPPRQPHINGSGERASFRQLLQTDLKRYSKNTSEGFNPSECSYLQFIGKVLPFYVQLSLPRLA
jgi:hypothetical protein